MTIVSFLKSTTNDFRIVTQHLKSITDDFMFLMLFLKSTAEGLINPKTGIQSPPQLPDWCVRMFGCKVGCWPCL